MFCLPDSSFWKYVHPGMDSKQTFFLFFNSIKCKTEGGKILKVDESVEISKILGLIDNIEEYQKIYNHA